MNLSPNCVAIKTLRFSPDLRLHESSGKLSACAARNAGTEEGKDANENLSKRVGGVCRPYARFSSLSQSPSSLVVNVLRTSHLQTNADPSTPPLSSTLHHSASSFNPNSLNARKTASFHDAMLPNFSLEMNHSTSRRHQLGILRRRKMERGKARADEEEEEGREEMRENSTPIEGGSLKYQDLQGIMGEMKMSMSKEVKEKEKVDVNMGAKAKEMKEKTREEKGKEKEKEKGCKAEKKMEGKGKEKGKEEKGKEKEKEKSKGKEKEKGNDKKSLKRKEKEKRLDKKRRRSMIQRSTEPYTSPNAMRDWTNKEVVAFLHAEGLGMIEEVGEWDAFFSVIRKNVLFL